MSGPGIGRGLSTRTVRKIEAPRPLKTTSNETKNKSSVSSLVLPANAIDSTEKLLLFMDAVVTGITSDDELSLKPENKAVLTANIINLCENLKIFGPQLENTKYQGQLDRAFVTFREGMVRNNLELEARVHLLNILELRECHWSPRKTSKPFTVKSQSQSLDDDLPHAKLQPFSPVQVEPTIHLGPDEIIKSSVQPTFKERLVQITGPSEENVSYATHLIEDTIRNNASPVRELGESDSSYSSDESSEKPAGIEDNSYVDNLTNWDLQNDGYQFKHKVSYNDNVLTLTGNDYYFITMAKSVLDDYFSKLTQAEYLNYYSSSNNAIGEPVTWENDAVFAEDNATIDLTSDTVDIYGAGDAEEDHILKQLHHDLNDMNIEPSSPTAGTITFSDSIDEIADPTEEDDKPIDSDYTKIVYTKDFLLECRKKPISQREPDNWQWVKNTYPAIVKTRVENTLNAKTPIDDIPPVKKNEIVEDTASLEDKENDKNQNAQDEIL